MKLYWPMKVKFLSEVHDYARALRAIGQDLASLAPRSLELEVVENDFIVRGQGRGTQSQLAENANPGLWQRFQNGFVHSASHQPAPLSYPFERTYTPTDVTRLDEAGIAHRRGPGKPPDISGLAERLRLIGRIVSAKCGRLTKVIDDMESVTVEYRDEQGEFHCEKYSLLALYKLQQDYYGQRGTFEPVDVWHGFDR